MKSRLATAVATGAILVTLGGCAVTPASGARAPRSSAISNSAPPTPRDNSTAQSQPAHPLTAAAKVAAAQTAETVIGLYARPSIDGQTWINALDPHLTQAAAAAFANTDPSTIPAHRVTGPASVLPASTASAALVDVPTDAGTYRLFLLNGDGGWLTDRLTPPRRG
jgi:hypothetical protein